MPKPMNRKSDILVYLVGVVLPEQGNNWQFIGIFSGKNARKKAIAICSSIYHFVAPVVTNKLSDNELFPDAFYPMRSVRVE